MEIKTMKQKMAMNEKEHDLKMQQMKLELEREMLKMQVTHRIEVEELKSQKKDQQTRPSEKMESVVDALSRNGSHVSVAFHGGWSEALASGRKATRGDPPCGLP